MDNNITAKIIRSMIEYSEGDVRRINHALKVYSFAKSIAELEDLKGEELQIAEAAGILHDIGIKISEIKYNSAAAKYQELEGPTVARELLKELNLPKGFMDRLCYLIGNHHSYQNIDGMDFQILVESDFLVNIFEGEMGLDEIKSVRQKYFKTGAGILYLDSMYLRKK